MTIIYQFSIPDVTCSACTQPIENRLKADFNPKYEYYADPASKTLKVIVWEHNEEDVELGGKICGFLDEEMCVTCRFMESYSLSFQTLPKTGTTAKPQLPALESNIEDEDQSTFWKQLKNGLISHWFQGSVGVTAGFVLMILCILSGGLPLAAMIAIGGISSLLTFLIGFSTFKQAYLDIFKSKKLSMDTLFAISTLVVLVVSLASFFIPWFSMMFEAALLILGFRHIGQAIKNSLTRQLITAQAFEDDLPEFVHVYENEQLTEKPLEEIEKGEILCIFPGEIIPVNGICLTEGCEFYTREINGYPLPKKLKQGTELLSGMRLTKYPSPLMMRVSHTKAESHLAHMDHALKIAEISKAPIQHTADRLMQYFIPSVFAIAALTGLIIGLFFPPVLAIQCAVSVLVSACPCILGLVVPTAMKIGIHKAAQHGVQFSSPEALETAARVTAVVFDLHGTLTTGIPVVEKVQFLDPVLNQKRIFSYIAALEKKAEHFIGEALFEHTAAFGEEYKSLQIEDFNNRDHSGVSGIIDGLEICIGNEDFMRKHKVAVDINPSVLDDADSVAYVAINGKLQVYFKLVDPLREDAFRTLEIMRANGIEVFISTGACEETANRYGKRLKIPTSNIWAGRVALADKDKDHSKSQLIKELKDLGYVVAMVGDAANDSVAVTDADFGVGVQSQSSHVLTLKKAGAIIQSGSLLPIATIFTVARQTMSNITQNLYFTLGYNLFAVLLASTLLIAAGFVLNPGIGASLMILQMGLVFCNLWRFKKQSIPHLECCDSQFDSQNDRDSYADLQQIFKPNDLALEELVEPDAGGLNFHSYKGYQQEEKISAAVGKGMSCC
ncbi:hypothetical protein B1207_12110 [Legionella quinlivanii]|uniref:P-type ATPase A domain-containing protein n=1 Tax=Legionella quinlivanii TaxID=45073 RepID=A0A364LGT1_9GAMM|nr:HAD-IC family P-type ATPase [Legionella quinlivanii]RAP35441.1 hypothetical protein B1207_12110 [Legionella quinlivanii]